MRRAQSEGMTQGDYVFFYVDVFGESLQGDGHQGAAKPWQSKEGQDSGTLREAFQVSPEVGEGSRHPWTPRHGEAAGMPRLPSRGKEGPLQAFLGRTWAGQRGAPSAALLGGWLYSQGWVGVWVHMGEFIGGPGEASSSSPSPLLYSGGLSLGLGLLLLRGEGLVGLSPLRRELRVSLSAQGLAGTQRLRCPVWSARGDVSGSTTCYPVCA